MPEHKEITSVAGFLKQLEKDLKKTERSNFIHVYRGHPSDSYELMPGILRKSHDKSMEADILRELIALQADEFVSDRTTFDRLVRMQHYGLPTRLLDVTLNPLVALFFACRSESKKKERRPGQVIHILIASDMINYFDSHAVSVVANLSNLNEEERSILRDNKDELVEDEGPGRRLREFILEERPYFKPRIKTADLTSTLFVKPKLNNRRILAQQGAFLLFGLVSKLNEKVFKVERRNILSTKKPEIVGELNRVNINESSLYPEIEKASPYIVRQ